MKPLATTRSSPPVVVHIDESRAPGPSAHRDAGLLADVAKRLVTTLIEKQGVAARVSLELPSQLRVQMVLELTLISDSIARSRKHVADIEVHPAVVIDVGPADRHARRHVFDCHPVGNVPKLSVFLPVQAVSPVVVGNVQVEVAVVVEVFPAGSKAEAVIVVIQADPVRRVQ